MNFYEIIAEKLFQYKIISERDKPFYTDTLKLIFSFFVGFFVWISLRKIPAVEYFISNTPIPVLLTKNLLLIIHHTLNFWGIQSEVQNITISFHNAARPIRVIYGCLALSNF